MRWEKCYDLSYELDNKEQNNERTGRQTLGTMEENPTFNPFKIVGDVSLGQGCEAGSTTSGKKLNGQAIETTRQGLICPLNLMWSIMFGWIVCKNKNVHFYDESASIHFQ